MELMAGIKWNGWPEWNGIHGRDHLEYAGDNKSAWIIALNSGKVMESLKLFDIHVWPVRDGE